MSLFKRPKQEDTRLKMYVYGEAGTGKTYTALSFPAPVIVDTEKGSGLYREEFNDFPVADLSSAEEVLAGIDELLEDPGDRKTFILDSFTALYANILRLREESLKAKTGNKNYELQPLDYKYVKNMVRLISEKILSLDMNVVVTARSKDKYAKGKFMEVEGTVAEGHKDLPYIFDVVIELIVHPKTKKRIAIVKKDRTRKLPSEFEFTYDEFVKYVGIDSLSKEASVEAQNKNINKRLSRNTEIEYNGSTLHTAGIKAKTYTRLVEITQGANSDALAEMLKEDFGVDSFLDLSDAGGRALIQTIENLQK